MKLRSSFAWLALALAAGGCASGPPFIDQMQPEAVSIAVRRAQFEANCPGMAGEVLQRQTVQPLVFGGPMRAEYLVGLTGCGRRATVTVICSENGNQCFEGIPR